MDNIVKSYGDADVLSVPEGWKDKPFTKDDNPRGLFSGSTDAAPEDADAKRRMERDARCLYVKNLPAKITSEEVKDLSDDIQFVRLRVNLACSKGKKPERIGYAYLEFASEELAQSNYAKLKGINVEGKELFVDYVGSKSSKAHTSKQKVVEYDKDRLYITGLGLETTEEDLKTLFPKAMNVTIPKRKRTKNILGFAFIQFESDEDCKEAHDCMQGTMLKGVPLVVLYASKWDESKKKLTQFEKNKKRKMLEEEKKAKAQ